MKYRGPIIGVLFFVAVAANVVLPAWRQENMPQRREMRSAMDAALEILGELRTFLATGLWFKVDLYHHILSDQSATNERELIPLYRLITQLDPHFVEAYDVGAWDLYRGFQEIDQAQAFIDEGVASNPGSPDLRFRRALMSYQMRNYEKAAKDAAMAYDLSEEFFQKLNSARLMAHSYRENGDKEGEVKALRLILRMNPHDDYLARRVRELESESGNKLNFESRP